MAARYAVVTDDEHLSWGPYKDEGKAGAKAAKVARVHDVRAWVVRLGK